MTAGRHSMSWAASDWTLPHGIGDELIDLLYAAHLGEGSWQTFLARMTAATPGGMAALFFQPRNGAAPRIMSSGFPGRALQDYALHYSLHNPLTAQTLSKGSSNRALASHDVVPDDAFFASEFYNDFMRPLDLHRSAGLALEIPDSGFLFLAVMNSDKTRSVSDHWTAEMNRMLPHFRRLAAHAAADGQHAGLVEAGARIARIGQSTTLLVGDDLRPVQPVEHGPLQGAIYRINALGQVVLAHAKAQAALQQMLRWDYVGAKCLSIPAPGLDHELIRLGGSELSNLICGRRVLVVARRRDALDQMTRDMAHRYRLTPAEMRVLHGLIRSESLPRIAERAHLSYETIRSQKKSLFNKLGVSTQIELLNLLYRSGGFGT